MRSCYVKLENEMTDDIIEEEIQIANEQDEKVKVLSLKHLRCQFLNLILLRLLWLKEELQLVKQLS